MARYNNKYSLKQFVKDCKSLGWMEVKASPAWMDSLDLELTEGELEKVLAYRKSPNQIETIMDFSKKNSGVEFNIK